MVALQLHTELEFLLFLPHAVYMSIQVLQRGTPEDYLLSVTLNAKNHKVLKPPNPMSRRVFGFCNSSCPVFGTTGIINIFSFWEIANRSLISWTF